MNKHLLAVFLLLSLNHPESEAFRTCPALHAHHATRDSSTKIKYISNDIIGAVEEFYTEQPVQAAFLTCALKASVADAVAQLHQIKAMDLESSWKKGDEEGMHHDLPLLNIQIPRNLAFLLYGGMYQGVAQHFLYNVLYPTWFGHGIDPLTVACKVLTDITFLGPFLSLPIAFSIKSAVYGSSNPIGDGLEKYKHDVINHNLLFKYWSLWAPVNTITFSVIPEHLRILFMASISFFWLVCLSSMSNEPPFIEEDAVTSGAVVTTGVVVAAGAK
jgi:protein Mpv17